MINFDITKPIPDSVIDATIGNITDGFLFERFIQSILFAWKNAEFISVGGVKDGGKDGLCQEKGKSDFHQISIQKTWSAKVRKTLTRLSDQKLINQNNKIYFYFSFLIDEKARNELVEKIWQEEKANIAIYDIKWIRHAVNDDERCRRIFSEFCETHGLVDVVEKKAVEVFRSKSVDKVIVFMKHFIDDAENLNFLESICFTHLTIILRDTDPDKDLFMQKDAILDQLFQEMPQVPRENVKRAFAEIQRNNEKKHKDDRDFRIYADGRFCLSHRIRQKVLIHASEDVVLNDAMVTSLIANFEATPVPGSTISTSELVNLTLDCLAEIFRRQGLDFIRHIEGKSYDSTEEDLKAIVQSKLSRSDLDQRQQGLVSNRISEEIYNLVWRPTEAQRSFLKSMARTYSLMFIGKADPQVLKYLESTARGLTLILGTDVIVRILAEILLPPERQRYTNFLRSLKAAQAKIYVTHGILREAGAHIRSTIAWYDSMVRHLLRDAKDPQVSELIDYTERLSSKILVRAYHHAKVDGRIGAIEELMDKFVGKNPDRYHTDLLEFFEGEFEIKKVEIPIDRNDPRFVEVAEEFGKRAHRDHDTHARSIIAGNDAETVMSVIALRAKESQPDFKNFLLPERVWWLTAERKADEIKKPFERLFARIPNIHPLVLVGLLANLPELKNSQAQLNLVLSGAIGLKMSHWVSDDLVTQISYSYQEISSMGGGKKKQYMGQLIDRLKTQKVRPIFSKVKPKFQALAKDEKYMNRLIQIRSNDTDKGVWTFLKSNVDDDLGRIFLFSEVFRGSRAAALDYLRDNGFKDDVAGIRVQFLEDLIEDE